VIHSLSIKETMTYIERNHFEKPTVFPNTRRMWNHADRYSSRSRR